MKNAGLPFLTTREPGGTPLGESIREILLGRRQENVDALAELFLYEADRAQHVGQVIRPALEAGKHVLSDRFYDSTTAYQAFGRGLPEAMVLELNAMAASGLVPDLTLLFEISTAEGLRRARGGDGGDRLEGESLDFHEGVWKGFLELSRREPERVRLVPTGTIEEVHARVRAIVTETFGWNGNP
jgi:dTMP kinase